jgi:hypothetical protein
MESVSKSKEFSSKEEKWSNEVQMHLQVMTVADITSSCGRFIKQNVYNGQQGFSCSRYAYKWPMTAKPTVESLRAWRTALRKNFNMQESLQIDRNLVKDKWEQHSVRYWRLDLVENILYKREVDGQFTKWHSIPNTRRTRYQSGFYTNTSDKVNFISPFAVPVDISVVTEDEVHLEFKGDLTAPCQVREEQEEEMEDWAIRFLHCPVDCGKSFATDVSRNVGKMVCDGSFKEGQASSAFVTISEEEAKEGNILPGSQLCQSAY